MSRFRRMLQGSPTLLIHNGTTIPAHMAKEHVSSDELTRALREHGCSCIEEVALAVLESPKVNEREVEAFRRVIRPGLTK